VIKKTPIRRGESRKPEKKKACAEQLSLFILPKERAVESIRETGIGSCVGKGKKSLKKKAKYREDGEFAARARFKTLFSRRN